MQKAALFLQPGIGWCLCLCVLAESRGCKVLAQSVLVVCQAPVVGCGHSRCCAVGRCCCKNPQEPQRAAFCQVHSAVCGLDTCQAGGCTCMAGACKARGNCTARSVLPPNAVLGLLLCFVQLSAAPG